VPFVHPAVVLDNIFRTYLIVLYLDMEEEIGLDPLISN